MISRSDLTPTTRVPKELDWTARTRAFIERRY
jgi:hypothetical protein